MVRMPAGKFKDRCLQVLDRVAEQKTPVTITKRGKPVATLVPYTSAEQKSKSLAGSILKERGSPCTTGEAWDVDSA
jgi:prevent-host-death family protein